MYRKSYEIECPAKVSFSARKWPVSGYYVSSANLFYHQSNIFILKCSSLVHPDKKRKETKTIFGYLQIEYFILFLFF